MPKSNQKKFIFFDTETGGLKATENSVLSISYLRPGKEVKSFFSAPAKGSTISKWAIENVWKPIEQRLAGKTPGSEEKTLNRFLRLLEANKGGTLAGWNIGYVAQRQSASSKGFDIPFLISRAEQYPGMAERYRSAIANQSIRDIGREYSVRIAGEVSQHPGLVDKDLFKQAESFTKLVNINRATQRLNSVPEIAEWMGTPGKYGGYEVAGWKLKSVYKHLFGNEFTNQHQSEADILATARIFNEGNPAKLTGEKFISAWNTEALSNKAEASLRALSERSMSEKITGRAMPFLGERMTGLGKDLFQIASEHKIGIGFGALAMGLYMMKPLSLFNSKDNRDSIDGLSHRGIAQHKRHSMTDFGSGYQGDKSYERKVKNRFSLFQEALKKYGKEEGTGHKRIFIPKEDLNREQIEDVLGFVPVTIAIPEAGQKEITSYRNPNNLYHIHEYEKYWTMHEDRNAASTMLVKKWFMEKAGKANSSIIEPIADFFRGIPHVIEEGIPGAYYYLKGKILGSPSMLTRLEKDVSPQYNEILVQLKEIKEPGFISNIFSGKDDNYNTIEGLHHKGIAHVIRRNTTDFGSGWVRRAISEGMSHSNIIKGVLKEGGSFEKNALETLLKGGKTEELIKLIRTQQGINVAGERFIFGSKSFTGGFGTTREVFGTKSNRMLVYKTFQKEGIGLEQLRESVNKGNAILGPGMQAGVFGGIRGFKKLQSEFMSGIVESVEKHGGGRMGIQFEAAMQRQAREKWGDIIPAVFGTTDKGILMEHGGVALPRTHTRSAVDFIEKKWGEMISSTDARVVHFDPHGGNVLRRGGKLRIIDWGVAAEMQSGMSREAVNAAEDTLKLYRKSKLAEAFSDISPIKRESIIEMPIPDHAGDIDRQEWQRNHQKAVMMASQNAKYGAKGHASFKKGMTGLPVLHDGKTGKI